MKIGCNGSWQEKGIVGKMAFCDLIFILQFWAILEL